MIDQFYVAIPVDTAGWTDEEKADFQREVTIATEIAAQNSYRRIMDRRAEEMRNA